MSDLFETYEEEFNDLKLNIEQRIRNIPSYDLQQRKNESSRAELDIKELEQILRSMNITARSNPKLLPKVKDYESEITKLRTSLRKADMAFSANMERNDLFGGVRSDDMFAPSMESKERLLSATEKLQKSSRNLDDSIKQAEETKGVAIEIMGNLEKQKEQMYGMRNRLGDIETTLDKGRRIMNAMGRRIIANKLIMLVIILVLLFGIGLVVYLKWFAGKKHSETTTTTTSFVTTGLSTGTYSTGGFM